MGACNGYPYHDLRRPSLPPDEGKRMVCLLFSKRGREEAERTWEADDAMLKTIVAKQEDPWPHGMY